MPKPKAQMSCPHNVYEVRNKPKYTSYKWNWRLRASEDDFFQRLWVIRHLLVPVFGYDEAVAHLGAECVK